MSRNRFMRAVPVLCIAAFVLALGRDLRGEVAVTIDADKPHQVMEGFGATTFSLVYNGPVGDPLTPELRRKAIDALYGQVRLNTGNLDLSFGGGAVHQAAADAAAWKESRARASDHMKTRLIDAAAPLGFVDYCLGSKINTAWHAPWLGKLRNDDYNAFLDACADQVASVALHWRDQYQLVPRYYMPFNEPTSGNRELRGGSAKDLAAIVKAAGKRLRAQGFADMKLVVPCEETVAHSLRVAEAILADEEARPFVGAIGYHCYPYGSHYASVRRILQESGRGKPSPAEIEIRGKLRDLARRHGVPLWMTEVSHAEVPALSFGLLRGRAIHIHDELLYADAAAFYAMNSMWDTASHREHYKGRGGEREGAIFSEVDTVVLIDTDKSVVHITGTGRAIGHYARWIKRGAVRLEASSADPLLQVTALRDDAQKRIVLVVINNADQPRTLAVNLRGLALAGNVEGEQSTERAAWQSIEKFDTAADGFRTQVPALSVTTFSTPQRAPATR